MAPVSTVREELAGAPMRSHCDAFWRLRFFGCLHSGCAARNVWSCYWSPKAPCGCSEHIRGCCEISFCLYWYRCIWNLRRAERNKQKKLLRSESSQSYSKLKLTSRQIGSKMDDPGAWSGRGKGSKHPGAGLPFRYGYAMR